MGFRVSEILNWMPEILDSATLILERIDGLRILQVPYSS